MYFRITKLQKPASGNLYPGNGSASASTSSFISSSSSSVVTSDDDEVELFDETKFHEEYYRSQNEKDEREATKGLRKGESVICRLRFLPGRKYLVVGRDEAQRWA